LSTKAALAAVEERNSLIREKYNAHVRQLEK